MSRQILSIEIRNDAIVAVQLNTGLKIATVDSTATIPLPPPSDDGEPLVQALIQLKEEKEIDPAAANVVVALPPDKILYRTLSVPFKEDNKIKQILPFELEPLLPVDVDSLKIDFHRNQSVDQTDILAVAIDQSALQQYMDALNAANIRPQLITPGGFPLTRYLAETDEFSTQQLLVLDMEEDKTTLFATNSSRIELVRRLPLGVRSEQQAEALALKIRQTLTAMGDHQNEYIVPSKVFITGTGLITPGALERISLALELPTDRLDMDEWAPRLEIGHGADWIPEKMNGALALALLEADGRPCANFHRTSSPLRNYWNAYRSNIMAPAMLLAAAIVIGLSSIIIDNVMLNKRIKKLDQQIEQVYLSTFPDSRITAPPLDLMKSKIKELKKGDRASGQNPTPVRTIEVLLQISKLIPKNIDVMLTQMTVGGDAVTISGETGDFNSVDDIKNNVEKGELVKQVTIASANMDKAGKKVRFKLKINL
jgi:type II secretion system protein L